MAIKTLNQEEKDRICSLFMQKVNQKTLAAKFATSARTIYRVLQEAGLLTTLPRMTRDTAYAMSVLKAWHIEPTKLQRTMEALEDRGFVRVIRGELHIGQPELKDKATAVRYMTELDEDAFQTVLTHIITARVAAKHNSSVANAMLQLQNKVQANVKPKE